MNVLKEVMNVIIFVTIPLAVIFVTVLDPAIDFTVMDTHVKVTLYNSAIQRVYNNIVNKSILLLMISDVNECAEGIDDCAQLCTDTVGSYTCSCSSGHYLTDDSRGCEGNKHFMGSFVIYNYYNIIYINCFQCLQEFHFRFGIT